MIASLPDPLGKIAEEIRDNPEYQATEQEVTARFRQVFSPSRLAQLTREDFKSFLRFKNNRHWRNLQRNSNVLTADMGRLRNALGILLDEGRPIKQRLEELFPKNRKQKPVPGLGWATATAILAVAHPQLYCVWNSRVESSLKRLGAWPSSRRGASSADKYIRLNELLSGWAKELRMSLFRLDHAFWHYDTGFPRGRR